MKSLFLDGRVGKNGAEIKTTKGGKPYMRFSLANNSFSGGQMKTTWYDVICYKPEYINGIGQHLKKGSFLYVRGDYETTHNVDQNGKVWINNIITADLLEFPQIGKRENGDSDNATPEVSTYTANTASSKVSSADYSAMAPQITTPSNDVSVYSGDSDELPF